MPGEAGRTSAIHATAVAIGEKALLIRGASRSGKSRLAMELIARSTRARPIRLVGDDRILLEQSADGVVARPHPRIAGFIERRGLGLVAMDWVAQAKVAGVIDIGRAGRPEAILDRSEIGTFTLAFADGAAAADSVLRWWAELSAAWAQHSSRKAPAADPTCAKD